ncbi:aspartyl protease family protein [Rheinheimera baltica]|uniref:aspartyl protease family protein n=1 Tax=Rheinheimera baltica TaxID=67576 RepID=UPI000418AC05
MVAATLTFDYKKDLIIVQATVGAKPGQFLLDTAAFDSKIERSFATALSLNPVTTKKVTTAQGVDGEVSVTQIPEFVLGQAKFTKTSAGILTFGDTSATQCIAPQGLIGANLMSRGYWKIDYQAQTLSISEHPLALPDNVTKLDFKHPTLSAVPAIKLKVAGLEVSDVLFDTGYNGGLVLPRNLADRFDSSSSMNILDQSTSGIFGTKQDDIVVKQLDVEIGAASMRIPVEFSSLDKALLGNDILEHFDVYLDYQQDAIYLLQRTEVEVDSPRPFVVGIATNNEWVVNRALASHPFKLGDRIRTINGKKPNDLYTDFCDYFLNLDRLLGSDTLKIETIEGEIIEIRQ